MEKEELTRCRNCKCIMFRLEDNKPFKHSYIESTGTHDEHCKCRNPEPYKTDEVCKNCSHQICIDQYVFGERYRHKQGRKKNISCQEDNCLCNNPEPSEVSLDSSNRLKSAVSSGQ